MTCPGVPERMATLIYDNITTDDPNPKNTTDNNLKHDLLSSLFTQLVRIPYQ